MWLGATNRSITAIPPIPPPPGTVINWNPGHYFQVGNENHSNGITDNQTQINLVRSHDTNNTVKGYVGVYSWDQLEGATLGDYSLCDAAIDPMVSYCQARGVSWSIAINSTGNVSSGSTTFRTVPAYLNSTTYGPIDANGNHGGLFYTSTVGPLTRITNDNVCARLAALGAHIWSRYGRNIFCFMPMWSELAYSGVALNPGGFTSSNVITAASKSNGFFDKLRAAMPGTYLYVPPTFIGSGDNSNLIPWFAATDRNFMANGNFDSCNESGGVQSRSFQGDVGFRGGALVGGVFTPTAGLANRVGVQDFATHTSEDAMSQGGTQVVPPANLGDGRLTLVWNHDIQQQTSHKFWANTQNRGPSCNCITSYGAAPANYAESAPWAARGLCGFIDFIGPTPRQTYPTAWP